VASRGGDPNEIEKALAIRHARTVLSMDTDDATALAFSAYVIGLLGDLDTACSAIDKALVLNPNNAQAFNLGAVVNSIAGRFDTVVDYARRSFRLNPFCPLRYLALTALSRAYFLTGVTKKRSKRRYVRLKPIHNLSRPTFGSWPATCALAGWRKRWKRSGGYYT
jgi:tetratricopeptide (TPR) repeat protein